MIATWYVLVSYMLITYVILDGRNFGAGLLHFFVAKTPQERRQVVAAIGPLWPWHEVWLIAFGGTLLCAFPRLMASAFSGYYLALFLILWCLILRGLALEYGGHLKDPMWRGFWDFVLVFSSTLLAVLFGAAGGNMARGVPLDEHGDFSVSFFTNFTPYGNPPGNVGILDWYTVSVAVFATVLLAGHGANYLTLKTNGVVHERCRVVGRILWVAAVPLFLVVSLETYLLRPQFMGQAAGNPVAWLGALGVATSAAAIFAGLRSGGEWMAFCGSNGLIAGMLATGAATIFPVMLYSTLNPADSLSAYAVASAPANLMTASVWWPIAFVMTIAYYAFIARRYAGKVSIVPAEAADDH